MCYLPGFDDAVDVFGYRGTYIMSRLAMSSTAKLMNQRGLPEEMSCAGIFGSNDTKTVVMEHHLRKKPGIIYLPVELGRLNTDNWIQETHELEKRVNISV